MDNFLKFKIKDYKYWSVYINPNQSYLGRCVIWCRRENAIDLADIDSLEREELFAVLKEVRDALDKIFKPDLFNYCFLGNETKHLHCHFIPRYASIREFGEVIFKDERWGHNYRTNHDFNIPDDLLEKIKSEISSKLNI
jgi:diadenosine tetraphosphate (Ap4A) HIT family hydrolase